MKKHVSTPESRMKLRKKLQFWFKRSNIAWRQWGEGGHSRSFEDLVREIESGACRLVLDNDARPLRQYRSVLINIHHIINDNVAQLLVEKYQVLRNGSRRTRYCDASIGGKILPGEMVHSAARRLLRSELGITCRLRLLPRDPIPEELLIVDSKSYAGLPSINSRYTLGGILCPGKYRRDGYVRRRNRRNDVVKKAVFEWRVISTMDPTLAHHTDDKTTRRRLA